MMEVPANQEAQPPMVEGKSRSIRGIQRELRTRAAATTKPINGWNAYLVGDVVKTAEGIYGNPIRNNCASHASFQG